MSARILIVEDEIILARDVAKSLKAHGHVVVGEARSGEEAVEMAIETRPDLVLMDIKLLGDMDGTEAARQIREHPNIGIVYVTAHSEPRVYDRAREAEPFAYLIKPFSQQELLRTVEMALVHNALEQRLRESEERHRIIADFAHDWEWWLGPDGEILYMSPSCERATGRTVEEFRAHPNLFTKIVHPEDRELVLRHIILVRENIEPTSQMDFRIIAADGAVRWIGHVCTPVHDTAGRYLGRRGTNRDITKRKLAEEALQKAHDQLELRVQERTAELAAANEQLRAEVRAWTAAEENLMRRLDELGGLNRLSQAVNLSLSPREVLALSYDEIVHCARPDLVLFYLREGDDLILQDLPGRPGFFHGPPVKKVGECLCGLAGQNGGAQYSADILCDARCTLDECKDAGFTSFAALPLVVGDRVLGVMGLGSLTPRDFARRAVFLETLADQVSMGLHSAQLHEQVIQARDGLELRVLERTQELSEANEQLRSEIAERKRLERHLRESEEQYRRLVDTLPHAVAIFQDQRIVFVNPAGAQMLGYRTVEDVIGRDIMEPVPERERDRLARYMTARHRGNADVPNHYYTTLMREDGQEFPAEVYVREAFHESVSAHQIIIVDISDRKRAEELRVQAERLRAVADLASGVSHNFNNLLQVIIASANLGLLNLQSGDTRDIRENLEQIIGSSHFGAETVKRLNRLVRAQVGSEPLKGELLDLSDVVRVSVEMSYRWWHTQPEEQGLSIDLLLNLAEGCRVMGRRDDLLEAVTNLIKNAAEAMPSGGQIRISTAVAANRVVLKVEDTGIGIASEDIGRLFTPFFTKKFDLGAGLGLASTRSIVTAHGGGIGVESQQGRGTTFTVTLPPAEQSAPSRRSIADEVPMRRLVILVIDDMETVLRTLEKGLLRHGHRVLAALTGEEGLKLFLAHKVDLVISDLAMTGMSGWDVGKAIRESCAAKGIPKPPFIIITGWGDLTSQPQRLAESGVDSVVEKPVDISALVEVVRRLELECR